MQKDSSKVELDLETNVDIGTIYLEDASQIKLHLENVKIGGDLP